jgi:hypothetical protein
MGAHDASAENRGGLATAECSLCLVDVSWSLLDLHPAPALGDARCHRLGAFTGRLI